MIESPDERKTWDKESIKPKKGGNSKCGYKWAAIFGMLLGICGIIVLANINGSSESSQRVNCSGPCFSSAQHQRKLTKGNFTQEAVLYTKGQLTEIPMNELPETNRMPSAVLNSLERNQFKSQISQRIKIPINRRKRDILDDWGQYEDLKNYRQMKQYLNWQGYQADDQSDGKWVDIHSIYPARRLSRQKPLRATSVKHGMHKSRFYEDLNIENSTTTRRKYRRRLTKKTTAITDSISTEKQAFNLTTLGETSVLDVTTVTTTPPTTMLLKEQTIKKEKPKRRRLTKKTYSTSSLFSERRTFSTSTMFSSEQNIPLSQRTFRIRNATHHKKKNRKNKSRHSYTHYTKEQYIMTNETTDDMSNSTTPSSLMTTIMAGTTYLESMINVENTSTTQQTEESINLSSTKIPRRRVTSIIKSFTGEVALKPWNSHGRYSTYRMTKGNRRRTSNWRPTKYQRKRLSKKNFAKSVQNLTITTPMNPEMTKTSEYTNAETTSFQPKEYVTSWSPTVASQPRMNRFNALEYAKSLADVKEFLPLLYPRTDLTTTLKVTNTDATTQKVSNLIIDSNPGLPPSTGNYDLTRYESLANSSASKTVLERKREYEIEGTLSKNAPTTTSPQSAKTVACSMCPVITTPKPICEICPYIGFFNSGEISESKRNFTFLSKDWKFGKTIWKEGSENLELPRLKRQVLLLSDGLCSGSPISTSALHKKRILCRLYNEKDFEVIWNSRKDFKKNLTKSFETDRNLTSQNANDNRSLENETLVENKHTEDYDFNCKETVYILIPAFMIRRTTVESRIDTTPTPASSTDPATNTTKFEPQSSNIFSNDNTLPNFSKEKASIEGNQFTTTTNTTDLANSTSVVPTTVQNKENITTTEITPTTISTANVTNFINSQNTTQSEDSKNETITQLFHRDRPTTDDCCLTIDTTFPKESLTPVSVTTQNEFITNPNILLDQLVEKGTSQKNHQGEPL